MYIQRIVYDSSCNFQNDSHQPSIEPNAIFNLAKDYIYVITDDVVIVEEGSNDSD